MASGRQHCVGTVGLGQREASVRRGTAWGTARGAGGARGLALLAVKASLERSPTGGDCLRPLDRAMGQASSSPRGREKGLCPAWSSLSNVPSLRGS